MPAPDPDSAFRRHVFFVAGYDPMTAEAHHRVFVREIARFGGVWGASTSCADAPGPAPAGAAWDAVAEGPGWRTRTRFEVLAWDDLVRADMGRSRWSHLKGTVRALADMVRTGTLVRYFRTSHRYGLFFSLTYLLLAAIWSLAAAAGIAAFSLAAPSIGLAAAVAAGLLAGLGVGVGVSRRVGQRMRLKQSLDLAEFSVDFVRGRHPALDQRVRDFAERVRAAARAGDVDEIVIAGHSLGAMHVVSLVAQALAREPGFGTGTPVRLLTLGSTTAKFALHPAGSRLRAAAQAVHDAPALGWAEFQARDDIVSFYKVDPVTLGPIADGDASRRPLVRRVAIRAMLSPETFARFRMDVMRLHCQFFLANDQRAPYDFYAFVCAPVPFDTLVASPEGPMAVFAADGSLLAPARPTQHKSA